MGTGTSGDPVAMVFFWFRTPAPLERAIASSLADFVKSRRPLIGEAAGVLRTELKSRRTTAGIAIRPGEEMERQAAAGDVSLPELPMRGQPTRIFRRPGGGDAVSHRS